VHEHDAVVRDQLAQWLRVVFEDEAATDQLNVVRRCSEYATQVLFDQTNLRGVSVNA
jgi:hypothetical protein